MKQGDLVIISDRLDGPYTIGMVMAVPMGVKYQAALQYPIISPLDGTFIVGDTKKQINSFQTIYEIQAMINKILRMRETMKGGILGGSK